MFEKWSIADWYDTFFLPTASYVHHFQRQNVSFLLDFLHITIRHRLTGNCRIHHIHHRMQRNTFFPTLEVVNCVNLSVCKIHKSCSQVSALNNELSSISHWQNFFVCKKIPTCKLSTITLTRRTRIVLQFCITKLILYEFYVSRITWSIQTTTCKMYF